ncbi:MAG: CaiB/BaiF CoA-transferase family protein [Pseudomonadota bacterium]
MTILSSIRVLEIEGIGPGPFCGMLLADLGAEVIVIERKGGASAEKAIYRRGKTVAPLDLKDPRAVDAIKTLVKNCDCLIEGMRPGVMERLGLGPDVLRTENPRLVYGRITGWGQTGPLANSAGHDINYVGLSGAAWYSGQVRDGHVAPAPPPTLVGDVAGGSLYLALGLLSGVIKARETGEGSVVDAAIVDGSAHMMNLLLTVKAAGAMVEERGKSMLDGGYFYDVYPCKDGKYITVGPLEPKFYAQLLDKLGLAGDPIFAVQYDQSKWDEARGRLGEVFASETQSHWRDLLEGTDVCFSPVLSPSEAADHPHMKARGVYETVGGILQAVAAPRFNGSPPTTPQEPSASTDAAVIALVNLGIDENEARALLS